MVFFLQNLQNSFLANNLFPTGTTAISILQKISKDGSICRNSPKPAVASLVEAFLRSFAV